MKRIPWNKGLNKYNNKTMAIIAEKVKKSYDKKRRKEYSDKLKEKYKNGDILTPEKRRKVILCGSKAWANKVKNASLEERKKILFNFITAGNNAQKERRKHLTPEDYQRLYPFAKGIAKYYNCDNCGKKVIKWFGGKKRSNKRFCCRKCYTDFLRKNPSYGINNKKQILFYSKKMLCHFKLLSSLEKYIANILEESKWIKTWSANSICIQYVDKNKKKRRYYPDFFFNDKYILEVKSNYVENINKNKDNLNNKKMEARKYCKKNGFVFLYWKFNKTDEKSVIKDRRIKFLFGEINQ
jgi:hypothetical protein